MKNNILNEIYNTFSKINFNEHNGFAFKYPQTLENHLTDSEFNELLEKKLKNKDFSSRSALELFLNIFVPLDSDFNKEDWLQKCYKFSLSKSFPVAADSVFQASEVIDYELFLKFLKIINKYQKLSKDETWQSKYPLNFLTKEEENTLENSEEYKRFLYAFEEEYIYEMMKLNQDILGYNTLDHVCGVHFLALHIARQIKEAGLPVDLGRVSGSAAGHDIGKYGCRGSEARRVPYLHYYYSDQWFLKHNITYIRNIAVNHSTWDLELENLSLESLILIYSDFRVKNISIDNRNEMHIFSLKDSFEVILNKLDNVDEKKLNRYKRVYAKLKDFENFLLNLNIEVFLDSNRDIQNLISPSKNHNYSLMQGEEVTDHLKYLSIHHNIKLMYMLRTETSLNTILELARSESDWKNLRQYLQIFEEYSTYLTQKQKLITLRFLYDELTHTEEDIRRKAAELIGVLIGEFDEDYRKEVPTDAKVNIGEITSLELLDKYMEMFLNPDHKIIPPHKRWIGYSLSTMIYSLFSRGRNNLISGYTDIILKYYTANGSCSTDTCLYLLNAAKQIPLLGNKASFTNLYSYILEALSSKNGVIRVMALDAARKLKLNNATDSIFFDGISFLLKDKPKYSRIPAENYLKENLSRLMGMDDSVLKTYDSFCKKDKPKISYMYLSNLKTATEWVIKMIQVEMLLHNTLENDFNDSFYTAMHFCNLLKVSAVEAVRNSAGDALIHLIPTLSQEQRNDVAIELLRGLELEGYKFAEFIPYFLGQVLLYLNPVELDEVIDDLIEKIKISEPKISSLLLRTIGIALVHYPKYKDLFPEGEKENYNRLIKMLGVLLNGLVNYNLQVKQMSFRVIGKEILGSKKLTLEQKHYIFRIVAKKILTLISLNSDKELMFLTSAAALNHIYRFISEYVLINGTINLRKANKVAFFPGTFDPFSLGHKEIVKAIRDLGFEVYLAVDEFSWSKQTRPHLIRRSIIEMSIADEPKVYLFPSDNPINLANNRDLKALRECFSDSSVYIVVGSDVITHASAYTRGKCENTIHSFNHIIFKRNQPVSKKTIKTDEATKNIEGEVIELSLEPQYEDISSTQIRNYIDQNRDIASLIDPLAQRYIYENGFYQREPQYKSPIQTVSINVDITSSINNDTVQQISNILREAPEKVNNRLKLFLSKHSARLVLLRDISEDNRIIAFSMFHWVRISELYNELKNNNISEYVRDHAVGRIALIGGLFTDSSSKVKSLEQILITETLALSLSRDYEYAVYKSIFENYSNPLVEEVLLLQGFEKLYFSSEASPVYVVNMSSPCTISLDLKTIIKEPFRSNAAVNAAIKSSRKMLQEALTKLYPGNLILAFNRNMMHENLIKKICKENGVPTLPLVPRSLGDAMCVPFGNILKRNIVPNTVTKSLHTEKLFAPDLKSSNINEFPNYLSMKEQVKMLRSFNKPVILVDDILHKGYRVKALDPILKNEDIKVQKILVGILSGRGKELMDIQNRNVDSAYYIPKLKVWLNENTLYPFMGGDTVWRGSYPERNLIPSINMILPYASPTFIRGASSSAIFNLSRVCIENAFRIMTTLEKEYQSLHERSLTLGNLGQVFTSPRCPEHGKNMHYDLNLSPSHYMKNDLELLERIEFLLNRH